MNTTTEWIQTGLLVVNAGLIAWYLRETIKLRDTAEIQVGQKELEGHAKPALIVRPWEKNSQLVKLVNIGSGPALHLEFLSVPTKINHSGTCRRYGL